MSKFVRTITSGLTHTVLAVAVVIALATSALAQQESFDDVTDVIVVEVPVQVIKDGEPVRGLTADNFEVLDGRKKREIVDFDVVDLTISSGEEPEVTSSAARRHFLFFFDLSFSRPGAIVRARQAAIELVDTGLHSSDLAAVASYSRVTGASLVLGFTPDRAQVKEAINTLGLPQLVDSRRDPLGFTFTDLRQASSFADSPAGQPGAGGNVAKPDVEAEILELLTMMETDQRRAADTNEILALSSAMTGFADIMQGLGGRKFVIFLSEGFDASLMLGTRGLTAEEQQEIVAMNEASAAGRGYEIDSRDRFGDTNLQNAVGEMLREFVKADATIQAVDIGGLAASSTEVGRQAKTEDSLFMMANETGGEFYYNFNNLNDAMGKMLERTSVTYVLSIQPKDLGKDGEYHRLKVKLKDGPKGARLAHRPGYFAPKPYTDMNAIERQMLGASAIMGPPGGAVETSVLATPFDAGTGSSYVPILVEVDGTSLMANTEQSKLPLELYVYALSAQGDVVDYFVRPMGFDLEKVRPALEQSGFKYFGFFDLPPGLYDVRALVRNGVTGETGVASNGLRVPDFNDSETLLLPPLFPEAPGKWLLGRDETQQDEYPYPFMLENNPYIPAARPTVQAGQSARIALITYYLEGSNPDAHGTLYAFDGSPVGEVEIVLEDQEFGDDPGLTRFGARAEIPQVSEGPYKLEVTIEDPESGKKETSTINLRVVG